MEKNKIIVAFILMLVSGLAFGHNLSGYECSQGNKLRKIEIIYLREGVKESCEVRYIKNHPKKVLWSTRFQVGYCEKRAEKIMEKQYGWSCKPLSKVKMAE